MDGFFKVSNLKNLSQLSFFKFIFIYFLVFTKHFYIENPQHL